MAVSPRIEPIEQLMRFLSGSWETSTGASRTTLTKLVSVRQETSWLLHCLPIQRLICSAASVGCIFAMVIIMEREAWFSALSMRKTVSASYL
ncbi:MAG: hypothetical protein MZV70_22585 [Desulfobacterales bacterium]|nr:hypothetical protein [Desulfobacterales bacterium]